MKEQSYTDPLKNKNEQWEVNRDLTPKGDDGGRGAFLPRPGKERPTSHTKTNECDH